MSLVACVETAPAPNATAEQLRALGVASATFDGAGYVLAGLDGTTGSIRFAADGSTVTSWGGNLLTMHAAADTAAIDCNGSRDLLGACDAATRIANLVITGAAPEPAHDGKPSEVLECTDYVESGCIDWNADTGCTRSISCWAWVCGWDDGSGELYSDWICSYYNY